MQQITPATINEFRSDAIYRNARKSARTKARRITQQDVLTGLVTPQSNRAPVPGHIITMETGDSEPETISVGDFVAVGKIGEIWRLPADVIAKRIEIGTDPTDQRWAFYVDNSIRRVVQLKEDISIQNPRGDQFTAHPGDWLVDMGDDWWVVEEKQFAKTHNLI